jgi:hypothetical protein
MPRFRLRTLLIVMALGPTVLTGAWFLWRAFRPPAPVPHVFGGLVETHPDGTQTQVQFLSDGTMRREKLPQQP